MSDLPINYFLVFIPSHTVKNNKRLLMVIPWAAFVYTGRNGLR